MTKEQAKEILKKLTYEEKLKLLKILEALERKNPLN